GFAEYGVGSGLTWYSSAESERKEWWQKTQFLRASTTEFQLLETLRLDHGLWVRLDLHLNRMREAARFFGFVWNESQIMNSLEKVGSTQADAVWKARLLLNAQGELSVQLDPLPKPPPFIEVRLGQQPMTAKGEWVRYKTTYRPHYELHAPTHPQVFDTLLVDREELVTECCRFNVVFKIENRLVTPRMSTGKQANLLGGVFRAFLLGENTVSEADVAASDLGLVQRAWLINSLREWVEIDRLADSEGKLIYQKAID
ncbi:MAG: aminotransferase class IV, partial [Limnobacter sp.]|nr:aminotransferase class IV [Limnobacter sp.]